METIYRFQKSTISNQSWEITITESPDSILFEQIHCRLNPFVIIKETSKEITSDELSRYIQDNSDWLIETRNK